MCDCLVIQIVYAVSEVVCNNFQIWVCSINNLPRLWPCWVSDAISHWWRTLLCVLQWRHVCIWLQKSRWFQCFPPASDYGSGQGYEKGVDYELWTVYSSGGGQYVLGVTKRSHSDVTCYCVCTQTFHYFVFSIVILAFLCCSDTILFTFQFSGAWKWANPSC